MSAADLGDPNQIIHIPARDLTGTREAKLAKLDMFLAQLQAVRLVLCGAATPFEGNSDAPAVRRAANTAVARSWPARRVRAVLDALTANARDAKDRRS